MKFMIQWQIHPEKRTDVFTGWVDMGLAEYQAQQGPTIDVIGRWHDVINARGVAIVDTTDAEALSEWLMKWHAAVDFEMAVVLDDEEAYSVATEALSDGQ